MVDRHVSRYLSRWFSDYGMVFVLLLLCGYYSYATWGEQHPSGSAAAKQLADAIMGGYRPPAWILIAARANREDAAFADELQASLETAGFTVAGVVKGQPADARRTLQSLSDAGRTLHVIAANSVTAEWAVFDRIEEQFPGLAGTKLISPRSYYWPTFLKIENLLNVANQIVVIAILAVGMTLVIITGGIDLSVGSLIALSAVVTMLLMRDLAGGENATGAGMVLCSLAGIGVCAAMGLFAGLMITQFALPPFIVTLGTMQVARGLAFILAQGESINAAPASYVWLGRDADLFGLPNAVVLMVLLYASAHVLMTRMVLGRYIYAVGGNAQAARLSGVPVQRILLFVYTLCGALAGLGGVVTASLLNSGDPKYGETHELFVIAAVVVGGTSLAGGDGKILGTLIGAFLIAVIQNGMNLTGVESYTQKVVLGAVILAAVLLDTLKKRGRLISRFRSFTFRKRAIPSPEKKDTTRGSRTLPLGSG